MFSKIKICLPILLVFTGITQYSHSQSVYNNFVNDVERLSARSTLVVYGKSKHFLPSQYDDKKETMFTDMEFEIMEKFYGEYEDKLITIRLPGGTIDGLTTFFSCHSGLRCDMPDPVLRAVYGVMLRIGSAYPCSVDP